MSGILVHEWLTPTGGSENVFEVLADTFPDAERFCLWNESAGRFTGVSESILAKTPLRRSRPLALPFMPLVWRHLPARDADWILCSSHAFAHQARFAGPARKAPKLVYAYTPARYIWVPDLDPRGAGPVARLMSAALRPIDRRRASEPVAIACDSQFVRDRIARTWGRDAAVIYAPVDVARLKAADRQLTPADQRVIDSLPADFVLGVSRFIEYKRLDLVIAAGVAAGSPVVLAGQGPDQPRLQEIAAKHPGQVTFVGRPSDGLLRELYRRARVVIFPPVEDFGIVPVEAMALGTPVVSNAVGGGSETVVAGVTGAHVREWTPQEMAAAVEQASACTPQACLDRADEFDTPVFVKAMKTWVADNTGDEDVRP